MSFTSPYKTFIFESYEFNKKTSTATFQYSFDGKRHFKEAVQFVPSDTQVNEAVLQSALELAFWVSGVSYYKAFPTKNISFKSAAPNSVQAAFLAKVYREGLSQYIYENKLQLDQLAVFTGEDQKAQSDSYDGKGVLLLQSGGKDSLLLATLLEEQSIEYQPWYISSSEQHPAVLDKLNYLLESAKRTIDSSALQSAAAEGALNGHVPVTYIVLSLALVQAVLEGKDTVLAAIGVEGEEPHAFVDDMPVNHQWSKTWTAEQLFAEYVTKNVSPDLRVGSPLRSLSELRIAELFAEHSWQRFGKLFSSCNNANYQQGADNTVLKWCGVCPKCANSFLLFAPFVSIDQLRDIFSGQDLFAQPQLQETFKGLLGVGDVMKPFECVGEVAELRLAYHMAQKKHVSEIAKLSFTVPEGPFDYLKHAPSQEWANKFVTPV